VETKAVNLKKEGKNWYKVVGRISGNSLDLNLAYENNSVVSRITNRSLKGYHMGISNYFNTTEKKVACAVGVVGGVSFWEFVAKPLYRLAKEKFFNNEAKAEAKTEQSKEEPKAA